MTAKIDFYTNAMSRGRIAHWMMEEVGQPYETHWVDYGPAMKSPEYLNINPMGKVPALVHDGTVITECAAICTFLAAAYPQSGLIPQDSGALANFYRWMFFAAGPVEQVLTVKSMEWTIPPDKEMSMGFGNADYTLNALELALAQGPWICGEQFTAVDVYVGSHVSWGMQFGTMEERANFREYADRCGEREAYQRADKINEKHLAETGQTPPGRSD